MRIYQAFAAASVIAISTMLAGQAAAAEWWYVSEANDKTLDFIDAATMVREGQLVKYWQYAINPITSSGDKSGKYRSETNCSTRKFRTFTAVTYSHDDKPTTTQGVSASTDIVPDTVGDDILKFVCFPKPAKSDAFFKLNSSPEEFATKWRAVENGDAVPPK